MSQHTLTSHLYAAGEGVKQDYAQAATLFRRACIAGEMPSCKNLGVLYLQGNGVAQDVSAATTLFDKACTGGDGRTCAALAQALAEGSGGITQDTKRAKALYERAATLLQSECDLGSGEACSAVADIRLRQKQLGTP